MRVRLARPGDEPAIARVHVDSWRTTYPGIVPDEVLASLSVEQRKQQWTQTLQNPAVFVFVAEDEQGDIVGFASGGPEREADPDYQGELYAIYLLESQQGKGLGRQLVRAVADRLKAQGLNSMLIWVLADNAACRFYAAMGGVPVREKEVTEGTATLKDIAYGWPDLSNVR